jgi:uncharacterized membrane protein YeaQ/YmgE (transglycosylase-associated protein family)
MHITFWEAVALAIIAFVCGAIGQAIAGVTRRGCIATIALGFIGALLGRVVAEKLSLPSLLDIDIGGSPFPVVWSILFSAAFVAVISWMQRGKSNSAK